MTVTLDLRPEIVARLQAEAKRQAVPMEKIVEAALAALPGTEETPNPEVLKLARRGIEEHRPLWEALA